MPLAEHKLKTRSQNSMKVGLSITYIYFVILNLPISNER